MRKILSLSLLAVLIYTACSGPKQMTADLSDLSDVSYESHVKGIVANNCLTCHSGEFASADMSLDSYDKLVSATKSRGVLKRINDHKNPMPTSGLMSVEERNAIRKWVENDFAKTSKTSAMNNTTKEEYEFKAPDLKAVNIEERGFEFMEQMKGHWVGDMFLLGQDIPWFAFDFRPISESQVHGLFEGGSMGNLFNTFFIGEYKGVKTIMLRNGGILSGIYRTSYFVLTEAKKDEYLFVDAYGGKQIMWMRVRFNGDKMNMLVHTSKLGMKQASRHMEFNGKRAHTDLADAAAQKYAYPQKKVFASFPEGMPKAEWGNEYPTVTSSSYIMMVKDNTDYATLGQWAQDPIQIHEVPGLSSLRLNFSRQDLSKDKKVSVYLSREPLTDAEGKMYTEYGYITQNAMDEVILFPEIDGKENAFTFLYLHPGTCYLTCVIDNDKDLTPSRGDYYCSSVKLELEEGKESSLVVDNILNTIQ